MRTALRIGLIGLVVLAAAVGVVIVATDPTVGGAKGRESRQRRTSTVEKARSRGTEQKSDEAVPLYSAGFLDDSGFDLATSFMPQDYDRSDLEAHRAALKARTRRGIARYEEQLSRLTPELASSNPRAAASRARIEMLIGLVHMHDGEFQEAARWIEAARKDGIGSSLPRQFQENFTALLGMAALRRGEVENCVACVGPSSCIFPIAPEAKHQFPSGSRAAIGHFLEYLKLRPNDQGVRWLLNVAAMTLNEYPASVPGEFLIPLDRFRSAVSPGRFPNIAAEVGLDARGANMAGGSAFDDFTGDGLPDVFLSSTDWDLGATLFVNRGDGQFEERDAARAGLSGQDMSLNLNHTDYDNDGHLDVLILRGGWEGAARMSLLRNQGDGTFKDVTVASGLAEPIAAQAGAWGDYDNDGRLDLYVVGEYHGDPPDPRNLCRLYHNNGDGTFTNVADKAGVTNGRWAKGATWGDYDEDGKPDLYVSNMWGANRLYHNNGDGTFDDVAAEAGVADPYHSFSCWFWDYDNDGKLDLFVCGYFARLNDIVSDILGKPTSAERPRLYRNLGNGRFADVTAAAGLDRVMLPMGTNFADIDNDGYLDMYLGTGQPSYMTLTPNLFFKNVAGTHFVDVTEATGTGHLQKGHGVSFADWDGDGDLDMFVQMGGVTPGDRSHNVFFANPGTEAGSNRHWLGVKLVGVQTNRAAIGARIQADVKRADGTRRSIVRLIGSGSSFGGNSLVAHLGLGEASVVESLTVTWPVNRARQVFRQVAADRTIEIVEGSKTYRELDRKPARARGDGAPSRSK